MLGITLVQTGYVFGFNGSYADVMCIGILVLLSAQRILVPLAALITFSVVCTLTLTTALFLTPVVFGVDPTIKDMLDGLIKYAVTFAFFVGGYNLAARDLLPRLFRYYAWSALLIGALGVALTLSGTGFGRSIFFLDASDRYRGLVSDPNLWATLLMSALPYFMRTGGARPRSVIPVLLTATLAILVTGSKTGTIALIAYIGFLALRWAITSTRSQVNLVVVLATLAGILAILPVLPSAQESSDIITARFPVAERITTLFLDTEAAVNEDGSNREESLVGAVSVIEVSPLLGVGVGQYLPVVDRLTGVYVLAHNTYLQMAAEWGIPLTFLLFAAVLVLLVARPAGASPPGLVRMQREMLCLLLIGSLSVSFNNVRLFWLLLGSLSWLVLRGQGARRSELLAKQSDQGDG